jgi:hypothetical protein
VNIVQRQLSIFSSISWREQFGRVNSKTYKICICCFSANYAAFRSKSKNWLTRNQNNISEWSFRLLFQRVALLQSCSVYCLVQSEISIVSSKCKLFSPWYSWKNAQVFELTRPGLEPTIRRGHANHYATYLIREYSNFETEHSSAFHKILMKNIEIVTNYILDFNSINSVFNYAIYSMYFDRLLDN